MLTFKLLVISSDASCEEHTNCHVTAHSQRFAKQTIASPCCVSAPTISVCQGTTISDWDQFFISKGAGCTGTCTPVFGHAAVNMNAAGTYQYTVTSGTCTATGIFTVLPQPAISSEPQSQAVCESSPVTFSVGMNPTDSGQYRYQWQKNTGSGYSDLSEAKGASLTINSPTLADSGSKYRVKVSYTSTGCGIDSAEATLTVNDCLKPYIACPGDKAVFSDTNKDYATITDLGTATASDNVGVASITNNAPANNQYPVGTTTVTWTARDAAGNSATCDQKITVSMNSDLSVTMVCHDLTAGQDDQNACTVTITNNGPSIATGASLADTLPDTTPAGGFKNIQYTLDGASLPAWTGNLDLGNMASGQTKTLEIYTDVSSDVTSVGQSSASVTSISQDLNTGNNAASCSNTILANSDLSMTMVCHDLTAGQDDQNACTVTITNNGPSIATGVSLADTLPDTTPAGGFKNIHYTLDGASLPAWTGNLDLGNMASGQTRTLEIYADVSSDVTSVGQSSASVTSISQDLNTGNNAASCSNTILVKSDLSVTMVCHDLTAGQDDQNACTVTITNNGPSIATGVSLADTLPDTTPAGGFKNIHYTLDGASLPAWTGNLDLGNMASGQTRTLEIYADVSYDVTSVGQSSASVTSISQDLNTGNNAASCSNTILVKSDLSVTMVCHDLTAGQDDQNACTVTITNNGPSIATGVSLADTLPDTTPAGGFKNIHYTLDGASLPAWTGNLDLGNMASGQTRTLEIYADVSYDVTSVGQSSASVTSISQDLNTGNNAASCSNTILVKSDLSVTMVCHDLTAGQDDQNACTVTITNNGPSVATGVSLADTLPDTTPAGGFKNIHYTLDGASLPAWTGNLDLGNMASGQTKTLEIYADVSYDVTSVGQSSASVTSISQDLNTGNNAASCSNTILAKSDLSMTMVCHDLVAGQDDQNACTVTITNNGPSIATGVSLADTLPDTTPAGGFKNIHYTLDGASLPAWTGNLDLGNMASGQTKTLEIYADVSSDVTSVGQSSASVTSISPDLNTGNNAASCSNTILAKSDLSVTMVCHDLVAGQDDQNACTVTITNNGPSIATGVSLADTLPDTTPAGGFENIQYTLDGASLPAWTGNLDLGNMASGQTRTLEIYADVSSDVTSVGQSSASVTSISPDLNTGNNAASCSNTILVKSDLSMTMVCHDLTAGQDDQNACTVTITNNGPSVATGVSLADTLPDTTPAGGFKNIHYTLDGASLPAWTGNLDLGNMASGQTKTLEIYADVSSDVTSVGQSSASVTSISQDLNTGNNAASCSNTILAKSDLSMTMVCHDLVAGQDDQNACTVTITNNGPSVATGASLADTLPDTTPAGGFKNIHYTLDGASLPAWTGNLDLGNMASGQTKTLEIYADVSSDVTSVGQSSASVTSISPDLNTGNNAASCSNTILAKSDLSMTMVCHDLVAGQDDQNACTVTITNNGPSVATGASLADTLPDTTPAGGFKNIHYTLDGASLPAWTGNLDLGNMASGQTRTLEIYADVSSDVTSVGQSNAWIISSSTDPNANNNNAQACTNTVLVRSDLSVTKICHDLTAGVDNQNAYTITVANNGPSGAADVILTDDMPVTTPTGGLSNIKYMLDDVALNPWTGSLDLNDIAKGGSKTVEIYADVSKDVTAVGQNTASITSSSTDTNSDNNVASCSNAIKSQSLSGRLWKDADGDGQQGAAAAEPGLSGWTIELKNKDTGQMVSTKSGPDGSYRFHGVAPGDYILSEVLRDNWIQTAPASKIYEVHVTDFNIGSKDFGNRNLVEALQAALVVDPPVTTPGSTVTFTAAIDNIGETVVNTVRVTLTLPAGINFISASPKQDIVVNNPNGTTTLIWNSLPLAAVSTEANNVGSSGPNLPIQSGSITVTTNADPSFLGTANVNLFVKGTSSVAEVKVITTVGNIEVVTPEPHIIKTADSNQVLPGGTVCYSITYWNPGEANLTGVEVADRYPAGTTFIYSIPEPDSITENHWTIGELPAGTKGTITVCLKVPEKMNMTFYSQERAKGTGFVNTYRNMDTGFEPYSLTNVAVLSCAEANPVSSSASVEVADQAGTTLTQIESGSGSYSREGQTRIITSNKTIQVDSNLAANYAPTSFSLPKGRLMNFTSRWSEADLAMNERTGASLDERYLYANSIIKDSSIYLDENRSILATDSHFLGNGHIGTLKKSGPDDLPKAAPIFEGTEIYSGEFHLNETVREYGSNVISNKSASGSGFVSSDKSIRESQRTYEYGAGSYKSDELIRTPESFVAKDLQATRAPANYSYSPGFSSFKSGPLSGSSLKWAEGVWSRSRESSNPRDKEGSLISEEISGADYIQAETVAGGLNDLDSRINYSGIGTFRAVLKDEVDLAEVYAGEYQIERKIHLTGVSKYDRPHLSLMKTGNIIYNPITNITVASYTITVQNDGNKALGPVYVKDLFPVGTGYINSSVEPYQLETRLANWTFVYMSIGQTLSINLNLNVTDQRDQMVNRVYALGYYDDHYVTASNFTVNEFAWLPCCEQKLRAYKIASMDPGDPRLIRYRIGIKNDMECPMVARVIDILPDGLRFINSSIQPEPIADNLSWALANISAGKIAVIDYRVQAVNGGRFVNQAHIEVYAVDGSGSSVADVSAAINVGDLPSVRDSSGWSPPDWGLDQSEYICSGELDGSGWVSSAPVCTSCSLDDV